MSKIGPPPEPKTNVFDNSRVYNIRILEIKFNESHMLKYNLKHAHKSSVQNGGDTFPNELMRFRFEAKPIWDNIQKQCKGSHFVNLALTCYFGNN